MFLTAEELTAQTGVPLRTLRYYIAEGLITGPGARGKGARYTYEHLVRLRAIRKLVSEHVPLQLIQERLASMAVGELEQLLGDPVAAPAGPRAYLLKLLARPAPRPSSNQTWQRHGVVDGLEVHVRHDIDSKYRARIDQALRILRGPA